MNESPYVFNEPLGRLVASDLSSVMFVRDYVQLRFEGGAGDLDGTLTCVVMPKVEIDGYVYADGESGYADALRSLISGVVHRTREQLNEGLAIELDRGSIVIRPSVDELVGPEIALLQGFADGTWMCWRPGEEAFEYLASVV